MSANGDSEPDQYSIDQIMDRLKRNRGSEAASDDGELVTRPDGSQAIRVRKRKRRSHQPHKEQQIKKRRIHVVQLAASLILVALFVLGAGLALVYANSGFFRKGLIEKITAATGAKVKLEQFRMNPRSANAALIELEWPQSEVMKKILARGLVAKVLPQSFLGGRMRGDEVVAQQAIVLLGAPGQEARLKIGNKDIATSQIQFARLAANKCDVILGDPLSPIVSLKDSEISFFPSVEEPVVSDDLLENDSGSFLDEEKSLSSMVDNRGDVSDRANHFPGARASIPRLLANRGELAIKGWPKLQVDRGQLEFVDDMVKVLGLRLRSEKESRGTLEFSGKLSPYAVDHASRLSVVASNFPLEEIAGDEVGEIFSGGIESDPITASEVLLGGGRESLASMSLSFRCAPNSSLALHGLPFLKILSNVLNDDWFEQPVFTGDVIGTLRREGTGVSINDLDLQSRERMAVRGSIRYGSERSYAGVLEIGIAPTLIKASGSRRMDLMFGPPEGNFRWVSLKVSGTAASPADDFETMYDAAGRGATGEKPAGKAPSFEELTRPE
jgi:hypothetical protein